MLTPKEKQLLDFIAAEIGTRGSSPTTRQMKTALDSRSYSVVNKLLTDLEARGFIKRFRYRKHGVEIVKMPAVPQAKQFDSFRQAYELGFQRGYEAAINGEPDISRCTRETQAGAKPGVVTKKELALEQTR